MKMAKNKKRMDNQQHRGESAVPNESTLSLTNSWQPHVLPTNETSSDDCEQSEELLAVNDEIETEYCVAADEDVSVPQNKKSAADAISPNEAEPTMTLLPPPPSWFQFEETQSTVEEDKTNHTRAAETVHPNTSSETIISANHQLEQNVISADAIHSKEQISTENENPNLDAPAVEVNSSSQLDIPLLPEYNSSEAHMFDLPVSFAFSYDEHIPEEIDAISTQSAIDTLISQTLSFTTQTVSKTIPTLLHECSSSAIQKSLHKLQIEYQRFGPRKYLRASDLGSVGGYFRPSVISSHTGDDSTIAIESSVALGKGKDNHFDWMWMDGREVRFTNLPWIERQLVQEWRTYEWTVNDSLAGSDLLESSMCIQSSQELEHEHEVVNNFQLNNLIDTPDTKKKQIDDQEESLCQDDDEEEFNQLDSGEYERARTLAPRPLPRPQFENASSCYICQKIFGPTLHRHHCRRCGHSYCNTHSNYFHQLPHLGYDRDVRERVCRVCKAVLDSRDLEERVAWRLARCRDFLNGSLIPYFETGVDTVEDAAFRLTRLAIRLARKIPLGAQAYVAIETVEILRKHGLSGVYGLLLRKEFLAAADLLCKILGINKKTWPLSVHELSAAIFYALAQHRALRGIRPDGEELIHSLKESDLGQHMRSKTGNNTKDLSMKRINSLYVVDESNVDEEDAGDTVVWKGASHETSNESVLDETDMYDPISEKGVDLLLLSHPQKNGDKCSDVDLRIDIPTGEQGESPADILSFEPVCEPVPDGILSSLLFYAPLALNFIYAECEVDIQLLAAQQGWRLVYASLDQSQMHCSDDEVQDTKKIAHDSSDKPASALFAHDDRKIACLSVRGTTSIQDVVTDIRAVPVPFPQEEEEQATEYTIDNSFCDDDEWTSVFRGKGLASCGMASAALNLFRENADALTHLARNGFRIRIVGHSLGGGVATLLGILMSHHLEKLKLVDSGLSGVAREDDRLLRVYGYGTPSCVDGKLADYTRAYATNVVLHDDVVPRLTPTSIRSLLKHLLHIRETWVKAHLSEDLKCYHERAYKVWPARVRESFSLSKKLVKRTSKKLKKYKKRMKKLKFQNNDCMKYDNNADSSKHGDGACDISDIESDEGLDVEGDLFFDALNDEPLNESDDDSSIGRARPNRVQSNTVLVECEGDWVPFDEPPLDHNIQTEPSTDADQESSTVDSSPQILEEFPLPRMFVPGKIVHIYTHRGGYKAAFVPRKFKSLRRISMAGNCLTDHMSKSYYESMLEVKSIRSAKYDLPKWVGFDKDCTCACCAALFTWASTSNTEAQAARDKHNCRSCGGLVCDPCSKNKVPIPSIGITQSVRVCDRCYNGWGNLYSNVKSDENVADSEHKSYGNKISIEHSRRSGVVDELAARLPTIVKH